MFQVVDFLGHLFLETEGSIFCQLPDFDGIPGCFGNQEAPMGGYLMLKGNPPFKGRKHGAENGCGHKRMVPQFGDKATIHDTKRVVFLVLCSFFSKSFRRHQKKGWALFWSWPPFWGRPKRKRQPQHFWFGRERGCPPNSRLWPPAIDQAGLLSKFPSGDSSIHPAVWLGARVARVAPNRETRSNQGHQATAKAPQVKSSPGYNPTTG